MKAQYLMLLDWIYGGEHTEAVWEDSYADQLSAALDSLPPRYGDVVRKRMSGLTLEQVARLIPRVGTGTTQHGVGHVTRERVRQMEAKALRMLRHSSRLHLESYIHEKYLCDYEPTGEFELMEWEHDGKAQSYKYERQRCRHCALYSDDGAITDQRCPAKVKLMAEQR